MIPLFSIGQGSEIDIKGKIDDLNTGSGLGGVTVGLYKNGSLIESVSTSSNGKYKFKKTAAEGVFTVRFSKGGYVGKYAEIDTRGIHPEDAGILPLEVNTSLFEEVPNVDFSILNNKPAAKATYNKGIDNIEWDVNYIEKTKKEIDKIIAKAEAEKKKLEDQKAASEKKFNDAVAAANYAASKGDYTTAIAKYDEALSVKDDADVKAKKQDAIEKKKIAAAGAETDKKYNEAMTEAKKFFDSKDYGSALSKYNAAAQIKPNEQLPKDKKKEIELILAKQIDEENNYNKLLADGEKALLAEKYDEAIKNFTDAKTLRPNEQLPKDQLKKAQDAKAAAEKDALAEKKKKEDFDKLVADADKNVTLKKYDEAIAAYDKALALIDDNGVKTKKENAIKSKEADALAKEKEAEKQKKQKEFDDLMNKGKGELVSKEYDVAITTFETALTIITNEPTAVAKLAEAKKLKLESEKADELAKKQQQKFDELLAKGDGEVGKAEYDKAIATYKEALTIFKDNADAKAKLVDAEKKKAEYAKNKADFDKLVADADGLVGTKKYDEAIVKYEKAITIFDDAAVKTKLENAKTERDKASANAEAEKKKREDFNALVIKGDGEAKAENYEAAIKTFEEALILIPKEPGATTKLADAKKKLADIEKNKQLAEAKKEEEFKKHYNQGMTHSTQSEFEKAIAEFEAALTVKPGDTDATKALDDAKTRLAEYEKLKDEAYKQKVELADKLFGEGNFAEAKKYYEKANKQRPEESHPKNRITECEKKIKEAELADVEAKKKRDLYEAAKLKGDQLFAASKWKESIVQYEVALTHLDEEYPKNQIEIANNKIKETENAALAEKEKKEKFNTLLKEGDASAKLEEYDDAIAKFEEALTIIEKEPTATIKLADAKKKKEEKDKKDQLANQQQANKQKFDLLIAQGDNEINAEEYDKAIKSYTDALTFLPNDVNGKKKLADAIKKKNEADMLAKNQEAKEKQKEEEFKKHYNQGMTHSTQSEFKKAITEFEAALNIKPSDPDAEKALADAKKRLEEYESLKNQAYNDKIALADKMFNEKDYEQALKYYEKANAQRPDEEHPKNRITECKKIMAELANQDAEAKRLRTAYDQAMASGNKELASKNYDKAIAYYENAKIVLPKETEPDVKIEEARRLKQKDIEDSKLANTQQKFDKFMNEGQGSMNRSEFDNAITKFEAALGVIPDEPSAVKALALAKERRDQIIAEREAEYAKILDFANKEFDGSNWKDAKKYYEKYLKFKKGDAYATSQIEKCIEKINEEDLAKSDTKRYDDLINEGNEYFNDGDYPNARAKFVAALAIFSTMDYPKKKIEEIDGLNKPTSTTSNNSNVQIATVGGVAPNRTNFDYGDKTSMSADEALSLLMAAKLGSERDKYAKIQKEKNKIDDANKDAAIQSEKSRTENEDEFKSYEESLISFSNNTDFKDQNTNTFKKQKEDLEKYTRLWNGENDIKRDNKAEIQKQHDVFDLTRYEEKLRFINADKINTDKDEMIAYNYEVDKNAANTRNSNGAYLQDKRDRLASENRDVQNTIIEENAEQVRTAFLNQHDDNAKNNALASSTRDENGKELTGQQDDFSNYSKSITNLLKDETASDFRDKHDKVSDNNRSIDLLSTNTRETNSFNLQTQKDEWANEMKNTENTLLASNGENFRTAHDKISEQNKELESMSSSTRNKNGDQLLQLKDDFANENKNDQNIILDENGQRVRNDFDDLNKLNQKMDETSANTRNDNEQKLKDHQEKLKEIGDKGPLSPAENAKKLKELQEKQSATQKKMDADSRQKHWDTKEELAKRGETSSFTKGQTGYKSQFTVDYPQGVTEEVFTRRDGNDNISEVTVRRIVIDGDYGNEYRKTTSKSGTFYFKNGVPVTAQVWDTEASK